MTRLERVLFLGLPLGVLAVAFAGICVQAGTVWPWHEVVHEDGVHTFLGTVFYVEHATRELIPDLILAQAVAGAVLFFFPAAAGAGATGRRRALGLTALVTAAAIVGGTAWTDGWSTVQDNIAQVHTRPGAPLVIGAHWRYHLIERFALILLAFGAAGLVWIWRGRPPRESGRAGARLWIGALVLFAFATWMFGWTSDPFEDPAYLGHQLRELFTHGLVTLPLALGVCVWLGDSGAPATARAGINHATLAAVTLTLAAAVGAGLFLLIASLQTGAQDQGQTGSLAGLLFPHFAEHFLGYLLVPSLAGAIYLGRRAKVRSPK